jgi:hypothetical protein
MGHDQPDVIACSLLIVQRQDTAHGSGDGGSIPPRETLQRASHVSLQIHTTPMRRTAPGLSVGGGSFNRY